MSSERDRKRRRFDDPPATSPPLRALGSRVYQVPSGPDGAKPTVGSGDFYRDTGTPGVVVIDNTADIGRYQHGLLLRSETNLYLGFTSPSEYSTRQLASCLEMFHDKKAAPLSHFFNKLAMVQHAMYATPSTHACLRLDFSPSGDPYFNGASETMDAVEAFITRILRATIKAFVEKYSVLVPGNASEHCSTPKMASFLDWFASQSSTKMFIIIHGLHHILERPFQAAYRAGKPPSAINDRLSLVRESLLKPIWNHLRAPKGAVRKFLVVGPYLLHPMIYPRDPAAFLGLPAFTDLSSFPALHGFLPSQIRVIYSLPESTMSTIRLLSALSHCNIAVLIDRQTTSFYTKESIASVFRRASPGSLSLVLTDDHKGIYDPYVDASREAAGHALFPLLLRHSESRTKIEGLLNQTTLEPPSRGPVFRIDELIAAEHSENELVARLFMLGLMGKIQRTRGNQTTVRYALAGGCAHALVQELFDATEPTTYTEKFLRRPPTAVPLGSQLPADLDEYLDVGNFDISNPTEQSLSDMILRFFRPLRKWKYMPTGEASLQMIVFHLLRAALIQKYGHTAFVNDILREFWFRQPSRMVRRRYRQNVAPVSWKRPSNLCGDLIHLRTDGDQVYITIYEFKWFNLMETMKATHAFLETLQAGHQLGILRSQELYPEKPFGEYKAAEYFMKEMSSMEIDEPHWHVDNSVETVELDFPLQVKHIRASYDKKLGGRMKGSGYTKRATKVAVVIAKDTIGQVAEYRDAGALGVADELAACEESITVQELARDEYLALRTSDDDRPETPEVDERTEPIFDDLHVSDLSSELFGWADKRITDLGPGRTVIRAFAVVCVAGSLAFVKELEETRTLSRKIGIVDSSMWHKPKGADHQAEHGSKEEDPIKVADNVYKKKKAYAWETKS